jgi:wobble nucleotide-excising tRNase
MIERLIKITRVGKFGEYAVKGGHESNFRRLTLIYGENGRGKSTLCSIFRSLQTGEGFHITERTTLNRIGAPEVHLLLEPNKPAKFKDGKWDCDPCAIEIFDANFVTDNIYVGNSVDPEQKRNLYSVIIGAKGLELNKDVDDLKVAVDTAHHAMTNAETAVKNKIKGNLDIKKFIELAKTEDIDKQIAAQEQTIQALKSAGEIAAKGKLSLLTLPAVPSRDLLGKTLKDVTAEAEERFAEHVAAHLDANGEQWLSDGYAYLGDKPECPFCGQNVKGNALIGAYQSHFNVAYDELKTEISALEKTIDDTFAGGKLLAVSQVLSGNDTLIEFWKRFVTIEALQLKFPDVEAEWKKVHAELKAHSSKKKGSPLDVIAVQESLDAAIASYEGLAKRVTEYNAAVSAANADIDQKKAETAAGGLAAAEQQLTTLQNTKERHESATDKLCTTYTAAVAAKKAKEKEKKTAKDALDLYSKQIFEKYQKEINEILAGFGAEFQISNTDSNFLGGRANTTFEITINTKNVPIGDSKTPKGEKCFRNTLSVGDRSALALAFFLVKLSHDENLKDKCVVFDDPVCSLDRFRADYTVQKILKVLDNSKQVIVLCHDPYFLKKLYDLRNKADVRTFFLDRHVGESIVEAWDIEHATRSQYFQDFFLLSDYVQNGLKGRDMRDIARKIRPLLEENLRVRYPDKFDKGWLGDFIGSIRDSKPGEPLARLHPILEPLTAINDYSKKYHHSENPAASTEAISDVELTAYATKTLNVIRGAV